MTYTYHFSITLFSYDLFVEYRICSIHVGIISFLSLFVASFYFRLSSNHPKLFPLLPLLFVASSFLLFSRSFFSLYFLSFSHSPLIIFYFLHQHIYYFLRFIFYFFSIVFLISPHLHVRLLCSPLLPFSSFPPIFNSALFLFPSFFIVY